MYLASFRRRSGAECAEPNDEVCVYDVHLSTTLNIGAARADQRRRVQQDRGVGNVRSASDARLRHRDRPANRSWAPETRPGFRHRSRSTKRSPASRAWGRAVRSASDTWLRGRGRSTKSSRVNRVTPRGELLVITPTF